MDSILSSVITDISGKSSIAILKAIISGEFNPVVLSELAEGKAGSKIDEMQNALQDRGGEHQLAHIENLTFLILDLDENIKEKQNS